MEEKLKKTIEAMLEALGGEKEYYNYENMIMLDYKETMKAFFKGLIVNIEGSCCSVDKSNFVVNRCIKALNEKKDFSLQQTYREYHEAGGDLGDINLEKDGDRSCYWCSRLFKDTKEAINLYELYITFNLKEFQNSLQFFVERMNKEKE